HTLLNATTGKSSRYRLNTSVLPIPNSRPFSASRRSPSTLTFQWFPGDGLYDFPSNSKGCDPDSVSPWDMMFEVRNRLPCGICVSPVSSSDERRRHEPSGNSMQL